MERLSSKKAKMVLEHIVKKKTGACSCTVHAESSIFRKYVVLKFSLEWPDDKGSDFVLSHESMGKNMHSGPYYVKSNATWASILHKIEKMSMQEVIFVVGGTTVVSKKTTIEEMLVSMELEVG